MRWVVGAVLAGVLIACGGQASPPYIVELGDHRAAIGDDPAWAAPDFDDSSWRPATLPATWRVRTLRTEVFGWHRFRVELSPQQAKGRLALDLGAIAWSDETFVNGQRVGATGRLDRLPRKGPRRRLYPIPDGLLRAGANVVAIRVRGIPIGVGGLLASKMGIGDELALERARAESLATSQIVEGVLFGFLVFGWLLVAFFPRRGRPGRATWFLLGTISASIVVLWLVSATFRKAGLSPEVPANVFLAFSNVAAMFYVAFVATLSRGALPRSFKLLVIPGMVVVGGFAVVPPIFGIMLVSCVLLGVFAAGLLSWLLAGAIRARVPGAIPIAIGCSFAVASIAAMFVLASPFAAGLPLMYYGIVVSIALAVLALMLHVRALNRQARQATEYALEAQQNERGRLARDLHDGLGQMLALLKLQMQRMGRKHEGDPVQATFDESAAQVGATLDELRRIARDLRPAPMEDRAFGEAVREYAAAIEERTDLVVEVEGDYSGALSDAVGDELYRITQECLTNCIKHSKARRVQVTLAEIADRYQLLVVDDGDGLATASPHGIGLETIRERSELLGGACAISTSAGGGTRVEISVPR